jgi:hypothetical protein
MKSLWLYYLLRTLNFKSFWTTEKQASSPLFNDAILSTISIIHTKAISGRTSIQSNFPFLISENKNNLSYSGAEIFQNLGGMTGLFGAAGNNNQQPGAAVAPGNMAADQQPVAG